MRVAGYCPMGCGRTLFVARSGHITCSYMECPNPGAAALVLSDPHSNLDWKQHHANRAEKAIQHPLVRRAMEEYAGNMGFKLDGLPEYGLMKVAAYAAQVARAEALGLDPEHLRTK